MPGWHNPGQPRLCASSINTDVNGLYYRDPSSCPITGIAIVASLARAPIPFDIQLSIFIVNNKYLLEFFASDTKAKIHGRLNRFLAIKSKSIALGFELSTSNQRILGPPLLPNTVAPLALRLTTVLGI
jgi:hypothetical protein